MERICLRGVIQERNHPRLGGVEYSFKVTGCKPQEVKNCKASHKSQVKRKITIFYLRLTTYDSMGEIKMAKNHARSLGSYTYSLRRKLRVSFLLMSILPLSVSVYLICNYILPEMGIELDNAVSIAIAIMAGVVISSTGFFVVKDVFDRITGVTEDAKLIAAGDIERKLEIKHTDEVGDLSEALNQLTERIRCNMDELKNYSSKTTEINLEIQKRVFIFSSLLQITSLVSQGAGLDEILKLAVEKSRLLVNSDVAYLLLKEKDQDIFYTKVSDGVNSECLSKIKIYPQGSIFHKLIKTNQPLILDKKNLLNDELETRFYEEFELKNTLALPVYLRGKVIGILGIGNSKEDFFYRNEDIELLDLFAKQLTIAVGNEALAHKVEKLEIKDALTGLNNEAFIRERLQEEIRRAIIYQRPCSFILLTIDNFQKYRQKFGLLDAEAVLKKIGELIKYSITEIDRAARTGDDEFAVILPEKNKRQAQDVAEGFEKKIEFIFSEEQDVNKRVAVSSGVSENPVDGITAEELFAKARELVNLV